MIAIRSDRAGIFGAYLRDDGRPMTVMNGSSTARQLSIGLGFWMRPARREFGCFFDRSGGKAVKPGLKRY